MLTILYGFASFRRVGILAVTGVFATLLGLSTGCKSTPTGPVSVPLKFTPTRAEPISGTSAASDIKVHLEPVVDKRQNKEQIGENLENEKAPPVPIYSSGPSPAEFVQGVLEDELKNFGVDLTDGPEAADRIISIELNKFWAQETNTYKAEIRAIAQVREKGGRSLWKGPIGGDGTTYGRSLSPANYNECLSDAARRTVGALLANPQFKKALER